MRSTSGVKMNWPLVAIAFAVIGVPMGVAVIQDLGTDRDEEELLARIGQVDEIAAAEDDREEDEGELERAEDLTGTWREPAMNQAFFDEVFLGGPEEPGRPALRGPLAAVRWDEEASYEVADSVTARWPRAQVLLRPRGRFGQRTAEVALTFPDDGTAERILTDRWGEPLLVVGTDDLARRIWTSREERLKLVLEKEDGTARATFAPCIPAAELIAEDGRFGFETYPILGATGKQLAARYGNAFEYDSNRETARIACPGAEVSTDRSTACMIEFAGQKAVRISMIVDHGLDPDGGPRLFAALRARLGEPRTQSSGDIMNTWTFDRGYTVTQTAGVPSIEVERVAR